MLRNTKKQLEHPERPALAMAFYSVAYCSDFSGWGIARAGVVLHFWPCATRLPENRSKQNEKTGLWEKPRLMAYMLKMANIPSTILWTISHPLRVFECWVQDLATLIAHHQMVPLAHFSWNDGTWVTVGLLCATNKGFYMRGNVIYYSFSKRHLTWWICMHTCLHIRCFHCSVFTYSNLKPFALCGLCIHFIFVVSWMELSGLHLEFEKNTVIRRRFQQEKSWLQWPLPVQNKNVQGEGDESEEEVEKQPICTKSLELNVDAVSIMMNFLNGNFANIDTLKREAILADPHCFSPSPHYEFCSQMCPLAHICISIT